MNEAREVFFMNAANSEPDRPNQNAVLSNEELLHIQTAIKGLRFGHIQITIQDGVIVQIDRTEKRRLRTPKSSGK